MSTHKRSFKIALVFVWALAHGAWMGAGWHAAGEQTFQSRTPEQRFACACRREAASTPTPLLSDAGNSAKCAICQLSTLLPDIPAHAIYPVLPPLPDFLQPLGPGEGHLAIHFDELPPQRGPPA